MCAEADRDAVLGSLFDQHYGEQTPPPRIVVDSTLDLISTPPRLAEFAGREVRFIPHATGEERIWLDMAAKNARFAIEQRLADRASQEKNSPPCKMRLHAGRSTRGVFLTSVTPWARPQLVLCGI